VISISAIRQKISELGALIDAPNSELVLLEKPSGDGRYHLAIQNNEYHYISTERGQENDHIVTKDADLIMYLFFNDVASNMASSYELKNRVENSDSRRIKFEKQIEIMKNLNESWGEKIKNEIAEILKNSPYDDLSWERVKLCKIFIGKGMSGEQAYIKSCENYPLPKN
jgi:hypothetical protein